MQLTVVHNPKAGSGEHCKDSLVAALRSAGHEVRYRPRDAQDLEEAIAGPADAVVLAGGDGTVSKLLRLLVRRGLPIGILPLGTANNLALGLGIRGSVEEIAAAWRPAAVKRLDVGLACGEWGERLFVDSVGAGAISQAMLEAERAETPEGSPEESDALASARGMIRDKVAEARPGGLEVVVDGRALPADTLLAEATIIPLLGPRLPMAPAADPSDGLLDLVYAREGDRPGLADWLKAGGTGAAPVQIVRVRSVTFRRSEGPLRVGDSFEACFGEGSVAEVTGMGLSVLASS